MTQDIQSLEAVQNRFPLPSRESVESALRHQLASSPYQVVVLDDDPTGVQTVYGVSVYTDWEEDTLLRAFQEERQMFFILTNSRSFTAEHTARVHRDIVKHILGAARATGKEPLIISRGDSTLRGHYPLETQVLSHTIAEQTGGHIDGEILIPFFPEGGRYTYGDIHYVLDSGGLVPAGETEFARDKTFGYHSSDLREWIEEKTAGRYPARDVVSIGLGELRAQDYQGICQKLMGVFGFGKVVVNALDYCDIKVFSTALLIAMAKGKRFLFRTAAAFTKVIGGISDQPLLTRGQLVDDGPRHGGLIVAGSHVKKTTDQLEKLLELPQVSPVVFDQHLVLQPEKFKKEITRVISICEKNIAMGVTTVVMTRRERLDLNSGSEEDELRISVQISDAVTSIVSRLTVRPAFLIAKGGITSSDIGTKGLGVKRATVLGQVRPGIPVWRIGPESKFPGLAYVIFPGNVGAKEDLKTIVAALTSKN